MAQARTQAATPKTPAAVKAAAQPPKAPRVHKAKPGTVEGPKGKKLADHPEAQASKAEVPAEQRKGERRQQVSNGLAQFAAASMQTPAVHEPTEEEKKLAALQEGVKALAASLGIDPSVVLAPQAKSARAPRADKQQQNGVTRPNPESLCGKIWAAADKISFNNKGRPATIAEVRGLPEFKDANLHTIKTQYARWRSYHGIKGRVDLLPIPVGETTGQS